MKNFNRETGSRKSEVRILSHIQKISLNHKARKGHKANSLSAYSSRLAAKPNATQRICHREFGSVPVPGLPVPGEAISRFEPQIARIITRLPITQPNHAFYFTGEIVHPMKWPIFMYELLFHGVRKSRAEKKSSR